LQSKKSKSEKKSKEKKHKRDKKKTRDEPAAPEPDVPAEEPSMINLVEVEQEEEEVSSCNDSSIAQGFFFLGTRVLLIVD
jgi:hypothetical protein